MGFLTSLLMRYPTSALVASGRPTLSVYKLLGSSPDPAPRERPHEIAHTQRSSFGRASVSNTDGSWFESSHCNKISIPTRPPSQLFDEYHQEDLTSKMLVRLQPFPPLLWGKLATVATRSGTSVKTQSMCPTRFSSNFSLAGCCASQGAQTRWPDAAGGLGSSREPPFQSLPSDRSHKQNWRFESFLPRHFEGVGKW